MSAITSLRLLRPAAPDGLAALLVMALPPPGARAQEAAARAPRSGHALKAAEAAIRQKQFDTARAIRDGDTDPAPPLMISDAAYQGGDYGRAYSLTLDQAQALRRAGKTPSKAQLQMLASAAQK